MEPTVEPAVPCTDCLSRRALLEGGATLALGLAAGCGGGAPPAKDSAAADPDSGAAPAPAPAPDPCAVEAQPGAPGWSGIALAEHPELAEVGGSALLNISGINLILAQPEEGCFVALSSACTHQGCTVAFSGGRFICPCHGAAFRTNGEVLSGPTPIPLPTYLAAAVDGVLWVQTGA